MRPFLPLLLFLLTLRGFAPAQETIPTLRTAAELRRLSDEETARKYPVDLRAVVTLVGSEGTFFVQDETGGSYIHAQNTKFTAQAGDLVEVRGYTYRGLYLAGIVPLSWTTLGTAPLPVPRKVTYEELASGVFNYERIQVQGTVRAFRPDDDGRGILTLGLGSARLEIIATLATAADAAHLIDAGVRVTGLAAGFINKKRQLVVPHLRIADLSALEVEQPAPEDPFSLGATPAGGLLQFATTAAPGHRVKVHGIVTYHEPGRALFIRDGAQGLLVEGPAPERLEPGAEVEVAGFAAMGAFSAELRDAIWRQVGNGPAPAATPVRAQDILQGVLDADLIQLDATLLDLQTGKEETTLVLRSGVTTFRARLSAPSAPGLESLRTGSGLRLTGIVLAEQPEGLAMRFQAKPRSFTLILRSAADVAVLHQPSWWTPRRLGVVLGLLIIIASAALIWASTLRRQVAQQTAIIREKVKTEAATEERERIAREFHDTLEQELVGLTLRLDAAVTKVAEPKPRELLESARRLVQNIQDEARHLVRNLRSRRVSDVPLPEAIDQAVDGLREARTITVRTVGETSRLPGLVEHELLRIAQESTTNAVKHGQAAHITITVEFKSDELRLLIEDDGLGFASPAETQKPGHFGLIGMRERMEKLGGKFSIQSASGQGATVTASVPRSTRTLDDPPAANYPN